MQSPRSQISDPLSDTTSDLLVESSATPKSVERSLELTTESEPVSETSDESSLASEDGETGEQVEAALELLEQIVQNELPIRLIYVPERRLVERAAIGRIMRNVILDRVRRDQPWEEQEPSMRRFIKRNVAYAILSCCQLRSGEMTFEEASGVGWRARTKSSPTAAGLKQLCDKAAGLRCVWAWANMYCVDAKSSAEVDETIRARYRWYRDARVCIVYLRDTTGMQDMHNDGWFRSAWTLQELLAPKRIKFYNATWEPLRAGICDFDLEKDSWGMQHGDEQQSQGADDITVHCSVKQFLSKLSEITGIPKIHLRTFEAGISMLREIMIWASRRKSVRIEDAAYSLLGIFNIDMPIAYAEGERAFYRLQKAIMEQTPMKELFVWAGPSSAEHSMFAKTPRCFAPIEVNCHFTEFLRGYWKGRVQGYSDHACEFSAGAMIPRGGREYTLTNGGLRMEFVLYKVEVMTRVGEGKWGVQVTGLEHSIEVASPATRPFDKPSFYERLRLGIVDYERHDAQGRPHHYQNELYNTPNMWSDMLPRDEIQRDQLTSAIVQGRENRWYTAMLLYIAVPGDDRPFKKMETAEVIQVRRPSGGWRTPETIYIR
ncbi:hypothetical protein B0H21DRAFT_125533 [Amylocystis lapponica]|nr:hypothetical protein B0H21DRAFT_125533 [Amylocystis lapponica]